MILCLDRSRNKLGPNFQLLDEISKTGLNTPLSYGGGIRSVNEAKKVISSGCERIIVDAIIREGNYSTLKTIVSKIGLQAVIGSFPLVRKENEEVAIYDYLKKASESSMEGLLRVADEQLVSELLIIDKEKDGRKNGFQITLVDAVRKIIPSTDLICFGGISELFQIRFLLNTSQVVGVGIGNFLNYFEHALQKLRPNPEEYPVRAPGFLGSCKKID